VSWFFTILQHFQQNQVYVCSYSLKNIQNIFLSKVMHFIKFKNIFFAIWDLWVSKDAEYYLDFRKMHQKKVILKK
jgi:hypothetical protein